MQKLACPKCQSFDLYRFGKEKITGLQKYRCKHCKTKFVPNRPSTTRTHYNNGKCPVCGSPLHIRKRNPNSIQLRCSRRPYCNYTISKPLSNQNIPENLDIRFPKYFRYSTDLIICALNLFFKFRLSSREVSQELLLRYSVKPSHSTIISWCKIFSSLFYSLFKTNASSITYKSNRWLIDETVLKVNGHKLYLFAVLDFHSRFLLAIHFSQTKDIPSTIQGLNEALRFTGYGPNVIISDRALHLKLAVKSVFGNRVIHKRVSLYSKNKKFSNNKIERFFSTFKQNFKRRKNPRSLQNAILFSMTYILIYNHLRVHSVIHSIPADQLGFRLNSKNPYLEAFVKCFI